MSARLTVKERRQQKQVFERTAEQDREALDEILSPLAYVFGAAAEKVDALPDGRHKALAKMHLEDAFVRACFATTKQDPLGGLPKVPPALPAKKTKKTK